VESTEAALEVLEPLMIQDIPITSTSSGVINRSDIVGGITTLIGGDSDYMLVTSVAKNLGDGNELPVRFTRANDYYKFKRNSFKKASTSEPQFRISKNKLTFDPSGAANYLISVLKYPTSVVYDEVTPGNIKNSELPAFTHNDIMAIALDNAGVATRDMALIQLKQAADKNLSTLA